MTPWEKVRGPVTSMVGRFLRSIVVGIIGAIIGIIIGVIGGGIGGGIVAAIVYGIVYGIFDYDGIVVYGVIVGVIISLLVGLIQIGVLTFGESVLHFVFGVIIMVIVYGVWGAAAGTEVVDIVGGAIVGGIFGGLGGSHVGLVLGTDRCLRLRWLRRLTQYW